MSKDSPEKGKEAVILILFLIGILIHVADLFLRTGGNSFGIFHFMLIPYVIMIFLAAGFMGGINRESLKTYTIISLIAYGIPFINYLFYYFPSLGQQTILGTSIKLIASVIIFFAPAWALYFAFIEKTRITEVLGIIYLIIWAVVVLLIFWAPIAETVQYAEIPGIQPGMTLGWLFSKLTLGVQTAARLPQDVGLKLKQEIADAVIEAKTGVDPAQARKDEANQKQPDAEVLKMVASSPKYSRDSRVSVYAQLKINTLEQPITANVDCFATSEPVQGTIFPANEFTVYTSDIQDIDCIFEPGELDTGLHKITLKTDFNFETLSYIETFFMSQENLREIQKKGQDPLAGYPQPEATSSTGPVNINIKTPPAPIASEPDKKITISTVLHNVGSGQIKEINELFIFIPKGITLSTTVDGRGIYEEISCDDLPQEEARICNPETSTIYRVSQAELEKEMYKNIRTGREFRMYLEIENYDKVIGDSLIKPGSFYASAKYDYEMENSIQIQIMEPLI